MVYVGVVNKGRGLKEAIHAVQDLNEVTLTIYGIGNCLNEIQDLVKINQLQSKVFLKGFLDNKAIHTELQKYDVGINLLQDSSLNYYYSSANKYFDYIMAGIPSLSMKLPEYEKHNSQFKTSILIPSLDKETLKEAILKLKNDQLLIEELRLNCHEAKKAFCWATQESKLINLYKSAFSL